MDQNPLKEIDQLLRHTTALRALEAAVIEINASLNSLAVHKATHTEVDAVANVVRKITCRLEVIDRRMDRLKNRITRLFGDDGDPGRELLSHHDLPLGAGGTKQ
jgi:hypothetical protein